MNTQEFKEIMEAHQLYLQNKYKGKRAEFDGMDLRDVDFQYLSRIFEYQPFREVSMCNTILTYMRLDGVNFTGVDLRGADLRFSSMRDASLKLANLRNAYLQGADFTNTDFRHSDLRDTAMRDTKMPGYPLLNNAEGTEMLCPQEGSFIAYKKLRGSLIAKLLIPEGAKRSNSTSKKCRASEAIVMSITSKYDLTNTFSSGVSTHDIEFTYQVGQVVTPIEPFDENRWNECASGIHFFIDRNDAVNY